MSSEHERLIQLKEMFASKLIRERRTGIKVAQEMLIGDIYREQVRELLVSLVKNDLIDTVRRDAQNLLDADDIRHNSPLPISLKNIFSAYCPNGHVSSYDKNEYCRKQGSIVRRLAEHGNKEFDEVLLKCKVKGCKEEFFVEVDCEGYK